MSKELIYPKFRHPIDIRLEKLESQEVILISCPLGIAKSPLVLVRAIGPVLGCFEGNMSLQEIAQKFSAYGLTPEKLGDLVKLLDDNLFLATARYFAAEKELRSAFLESEIREPALAGRAYSNIPSELSLEIDKYLASGRSVIAETGKKLVSMVAPHIDYRRGHLTYGKTYSRLAEHDNDLYIVIGTSHQYSTGLFHLTGKDFDSPLGPLRCDRAFVRNIADSYGSERSFSEEILHKQEHSLELQVPFLKRLKSEARIVPILVGSFYHMLQEGKYPEQYEQYDQFVSSLVSALRSELLQGRKPCIVAGVDMAHVGTHFGDREKLTPSQMKITEDRDRQYLSFIENQDKKGLFEHIAEDGDSRRICGFPTMYTVIDCFDRLGIKYKAELVEYRQAVNFETDCAVTFAGLALYSQA